MSEQIDVTQELAKLQQRVEHLEERMEKAESKQSPLRSLWEAIRSILIGLFIVGPAAAIMLGVLAALAGK
ncbi:hypothetical protein V7094_01125 [Priestia megaterium]|jgi:chaperonin cofactor prefoldin|uniref:hypothetical protein n=1 Tax=Priestia TaxID=2800373 RepID=UPI000BF6C9C4|nr:MULTISPECIES: hypothetical protein [Priestia]MCA4152825.1 hypothetical protein [Priestia megaterium]MCR8862644.1 hypothetical protein [Priestia megaterium]MCU7762992.1 hypothetical protein [Priestia megaterium]MDP1438546.1 hypothetical protein [Priestia megaterium]MDP1467563.1 hypothetical protein [Priestia megaterium]